MHTLKIILDAICFALYCRATGGLRTWKNMRSILASDANMTFVDYIFSLCGEKYRFKRKFKSRTAWSYYK